MSQTVIFSVGVIIYATTVVGVVMAGGLWLRGLSNEKPGATADDLRGRRRNLDDEAG